MTSPPPPARGNTQHLFMNSVCVCLLKHYEVISTFSFIVICALCYLVTQMPNTNKRYLLMSFIISNSWTSTVTLLKHTWLESWRSSLCVCLKDLSWLIIYRTVCAVSCVRLYSISVPCQGPELKLYLESGSSEKPSGSRHSRRSEACNCWSPHGLLWGKFGSSVACCSFTSVVEGSNGHCSVYF